MKLPSFLLLLLPIVGATPSALGGHHDGHVHTTSSRLESREGQMDQTSLYCGNWATGSRASAQALQQQLLACDDNAWGQSFTVQGTDDVKAGYPSPCIGLACDYVSAKDFHHTQFQLCNVSNPAYFLPIHVPTWEEVWTARSNGESPLLTTHAFHQDGPHAVTKNCTELAYWAQKLIDSCE